MAQKNMSKQAQAGAQFVTAADLQLQQDAAVSFSPASLTQCINVLRQNWRQGTLGCKDRGELAFSNKKPWKQKGTGRARVGSIRSPLWRKGGITFGPRKERNWELKINKKAKTAALFMGLSDKAKDNQLIVIDQIALTNPK